MYRVGICDDDQLFCSQMEEMILSLSQELRQKIEVEVWFSGESIMRDLSQQEFLDILFLDIELCRHSGIDVGNFIRQNDDYAMHIVYVSSKQEYAMQLFRIQPIDFLIKPVLKEQVKEVLQRSIRQKGNDNNIFEYQKNGAFYRILCREILYFVSDNKKVRIVMGDKTEEFYGKLKLLICNLPERFLIIHQSYIVNLEQVSEYSYEAVKMRNGDVLNISKPYRKDVRRKILLYEKERFHGEIL